MRLTYKIRHNLNIDRELKLAFKVAQYAIANKSNLSTKHVKHLGLNSVIADGIIRKYGFNKKIKTVRSVPLVFTSGRFRQIEDGVWIPSIKGSLPFKLGYSVKAIELTKEYASIVYEIAESQVYVPTSHIGVDLNTTGHCAVVAIKETGKTYKLGKKAEYTHKKYLRMRKHLQHKGKFKIAAKIKSRESRIVRDLNHKISRKIIDIAVLEKGGIQLEKLEGIRKSRRIKQSFKYALNSWSYYQLNKFIEYKALLAGVPVTYIDPAYTSKTCSRCGLIGDRNDKSFKCPKGHVENADVNAAFNIAVLSNSILKLQAERDVCKGGTATPHRDRAQKQVNPETIN